MCVFRWIIYLIGFFGYFLIVRLMVIVPLFSSAVISAMHKCLFRSIFGAASGEKTSFDECMEEKFSKVESYTNAVENYEKKLNAFALKILGDCK